jgi:hypothetical protein
MASSSVVLSQDAAKALNVIVARAQLLEAEAYMRAPAAAAQASSTVIQLTGYNSGRSPAQVQRVLVADACGLMLAAMPSTVEDDETELRRLQEAAAAGAGGAGGGGHAAAVQLGRGRRCVALQYRIARKRLLARAAKSV